MLLQLIRKYSSGKLWQEVAIPVPWGEIRGKWWGPTDIRPVLTLHGWQDNCGSFDRLIPLLPDNMSFLTIDLPGHGYSSRLPSGLHYNLSSYLVTLKYLTNYMKWKQVSLMGHSMGGLLCYTYTMMYPKSVDFLACIDGLILFNYLDLMAKAIEDFPKNNQFSFDKVESPSYFIEEIKQKIHKPHGGSIDLTNTEFIMHRNVALSQTNPGKYYFTRDPRLKSVDLYTFSQEEYIRHSPNISCPVFLSKFTQRMFAKEIFQELKRVLQKSEAHIVEGTHHGHLNNPERHAVLLKGFFDRFELDKNRSKEVREEIFV
ncbi:unnamed protein product [Ceutorhynchus assimilis]|uniref:AB hydrolase-1 domain-containing protein n=1 Tax=Ceutorhynchus assimilis TaxID=467358 RepID=A0A9N9MK42_9CUCU|nr:unnamed protein product [Ceutorhynchus assimilis]